MQFLGVPVMYSFQVRSVLTIVLALAFCGSASKTLAQQTLALDRELDAGVSDGCAADVSPPAPRSHPAPDAVKVLAPKSGFYAGVYQIPIQPQSVTAFADAIGHFPPITFSFHDMFSETNYSQKPDKTLLDPMEGESGLNVFDMARYVDDRGSVLALAWAIYCCDYNKVGFWHRTLKPHAHFERILRGEQDDFLRASARQIKEYGRPVMLTLVPEFNWQGQVLFGGDGRQWMDSVDNICNQYGDPTWPDGPERIRDLNMHVIDLFRSEGVKNVTWFMYAGSNYMADGPEGQSIWLHPKYYYPGDDYIDWIGQSAFFTDAKWAGNYDESGTFEQVFLPGYRAWNSVTDKPMLLAEFAVQAGSSQDRSHLWKELLSTQLPALPGVKAIAIAESPLFERYFDIPMIGKRPNEMAEVRQQLHAQGVADIRLRLSR